jgi:hypothetical protein
VSGRVITSASKTHRYRRKVFQPISVRRFTLIEASVIEMSRFCHGQKDKRPAISGKPLFLLVGPE